MPTLTDIVRTLHPLADRRRWLAAVAATAVLFTALPGCSTVPVDRSEPFVAGWMAPPQDRFEANVLPGRPPTEALVLQDQTLRQVVRISTGGDSVRLRLSNRFGKEPVVFDSVRVAIATSASSIEADTDLPVTLNGQTRIALAAGAEAWTDPAPLQVNDHAQIAVSLYVSAATPVTTQHNVARQTAFLAAGSRVSAATLAYPDFVPSYLWLAGVDVSALNSPKVLVAFGDSITDGFASTENQNRRYPDLLDLRLKAAGARTVVVNAGISGNRWLNDVIGPSGQSRFERDVLNATGVTHTLILLGINDIGFSAFVPAQEVSAAQVIAAIDAAVTKAKARGIKVIVGTLLPFKGARYYSEAGEAKRAAINAWIHANKAIDGVADFDQATRDPANTAALFPAYDSGDHLHPNDDGYAAMANVVDLAALR